MFVSIICYLSPRTSINRQHMKSNQLLLCLLFFPYLIFAQIKLQWREQYPGIWKATVGQPEKISLLSTAGAIANVPALAKLPKSSFPLKQAEIDVKIIDHKVYLRFPLDQAEQLFGLGLNFQTVNQRGRILDLHVDHYGAEDNGRTHAPVPFYVSSKGYGVLIDAARYLTVYVGTGVRRESQH
ncbi:MAG: ABC transporter substrate-binding protein, partial [Sphingobacteriales bacterium]